MPKVWVRGNDWGYECVDCGKVYSLKRDAVSCEHRHWQRKQQAAAEREDRARQQKEEREGKG